VGHRAPAVVEAIRTQTDRYLHGPRRRCWSTPARRE
jgi:hypothetical protein